MKYLLDTHTWIWWNMRQDALSARVSDILLDASQYERLLLSSISIWEFCKLLEKRRIGIAIDAMDWITQALDMHKLELVTLSPEIAYQSCTLPQPFHQDPGDQIIVATARKFNATIMTKDSLLLDYQHVKSIW